MRMVHKLKSFERSIVFMRWASDEEFGRIKYVGDDFIEFEILDMFKVLSRKECFIMRLLYIHYLSISEVADYMKISRQAVNQAKNRALKKLKKMYLE